MIRVPQRFLLGSAICLGIIIVLGSWTWVRNATWTDEFVFLQDQIRKAPKKVRPYCSMASRLMYYGKLTDALDLIHQAQKFGELMAPCWANAAVAYSKTLQPEKAKEAYRRAIELDPHCFRCYQRLGKLHAREGEFKQAKRVYLDLSEKARVDATLLAYLGSFSLRLAEFDEAEGFLNHAFVLDPNHALALEMCVELQVKMHNKLAAEKCLKRFASKYPQRPMTFQKLERRMKQLDQASLKAPKTL